MLALVLPVALAASGDVGLDFVTPAALSVPVSAAAPAPAEVPLNGPFRLAGVLEGVRTYEAPSPVRPRSLYYEREPLGMELRKGTRSLVYTASPADRAAPGTWELNADSVQVRLRPDVERPTDGTYTVVFPAATEREEALHFRGGDAQAWAFRSAQVDSVSRHGVLLPTGAHAAWSTSAAEGKRLRFELGLLPPEFALGPASDGATLTVKVGEAVLLSTHVGLDGGFRTFDVPLPPLKDGELLRFEVSDPDPHDDHVFLASPTVYSPSDMPRRIVMAFVDTLRQDHLPTYGYERATAPKLDAWANDAVVFEEARTTAPWTLPSTRSLWTGQRPESWSDAVTLQEVLREKGWATGAFVGNVYLSSNFEMDRGWGEHRCLNWPGASYQVHQGREFFRRNPSQDSLLLLHFMDLHLPYKEPRAYRGLWEKGTPGGLDGLFNRTILMRVAIHQRELIRPYLIDRYDQNLRYVDDQLSAFLGEQDDSTTVVLFADHGEEFFDHGDLEHGHTLYDELLRVPLIVKSPGLAARRVPGSVVLSDVAPTLLEIAGEPVERLGADIEGRSLLKLARGEPDLAATDRDLAIGRVLYGPVQWGSLTGTQKYISTRGTERLYDLVADPGETRDLAEAGESVVAGRVGLANGTGRDVMQAIRLSPLGRANRQINVDMHVPGGIAHAWVGDDPTSSTLAEILAIEGEFLHARFQSRLRENREIFVVPNRPADEVIGEIGVKIAGRTSQFDRLRAFPHDGSGTALSRARSGPTALDVTWAVVPLPFGDNLVGSDGELTAALEALGYTTGEASGEPSDDKGSKKDDPPAPRE